MKCVKTKLPFNGYVYEPWAFLVFPIAIGILLSLLPILASYDMYAKEANQIEQTSTVVFEGYSDNGGVYLLYSKEHRYAIPSNILSSSILDSLVNNGTKVDIVYLVKTQRVDEVYDILSIRKHEESVVIGQNEMTIAWGARRRNVLITLWSVDIIYWIICAFAFYVLHNAPRYPKIAALFVRKGYRNF